MNQVRKIALDQYGLLRLGVATPELKVADIDFNLAEIFTVAEGALEQQCRMVLFPELCLTGYTCADLFFQHQLQQRVDRALLELCRFTASKRMTLIVGAPIPVHGRLFNCAAVISNGEVCGLVPKNYLPNSGEFYEQRWFSSVLETTSHYYRLGEDKIPFGGDLLFRADAAFELLMGIEICEDAWSVVPPSGSQALAGATLLLNLSASPETLGKESYRRNLVASQSARCLAAYAYASAGPNESTTDLVFLVIH